MEFTRTKKGQPKLIRNGYLYVGGTPPKNQRNPKIIQNPVYVNL